MERTVRFVLGRVSEVPPVPIEWTKATGPFFGNQIATLRLAGRAAHLVLERAGRVPHGPIGFTTTADLVLSTPDETT